MRAAWKFAIASMVFLVLVIALVQWAEPESATERTAQMIASGEPLSLRDRVAAVVHDDLGEQWRGLSLDDSSHSEPVLLVDLNASDNLTTPMIRRGIVSDVKDLVQLVSTNPAFDSIGAYEIRVYYPMTDAYGNSSEDVVAAAVVSREVAKRINWSGMTNDSFEALVTRTGSFDVHAALNR